MQCMILWFFKRHTMSQKNVDHENCAGKMNRSESKYELQDKWDPKIMRPNLQN